MLKFVIITTQRTGATFFRTCLDSHPQIQCPGTIFPQVNKLKFFSVDRPNSIYYQYRSSSLKRQLTHWFRRKKLIHDCLNDLYARPSNLAAVGYKISYNHIEKYPAIVTWLKEHDVRIIHWVRNNLLKRFLSHETNKVRRVAHSTQPVEPIKVHVRVRKLEKDLMSRARLVEEYRTVFADKPYLEISYESFVVNRDADTRKVLQFLGIDEFMPLESDLVKLNPDSLEDIIENYEEVVRALKGTAFEKYLVM